MINHELRTPVAAVRASLHALVNDELTPGQAGEFLDAAHRRAEELAALVEDLLEVSKVADRPPRVRRADVDIEQAVLSALVRVPERIRSRLRVDVRPVGAHVRSDPYHLQQILGRLVDNALKFSERPVDVRIEVTDADLWVSTEDRGVGIPAEQLPFLFERFRQGEGALRRASDGVGLGLFVVRRLVEELGGTIDVTSTPGVGSTFTVQLPLVGAREAGREARSARA